jgi:Transposase DDE domain
LVHILLFIKKINECNVRKVYKLINLYSSFSSYFFYLSKFILYIHILMISKNIIKNIEKIFHDNFNYENINKHSNIKLRNNDIQLNNVIFYRFYYSYKNTTKESITSKINNKNHTCFSRQGFEAKENNIPVEIYEKAYHNTRDYYNSLCNNKDKYKIIAVDGTYNNDKNYNEMLNLGIFDVSNNVPIDIECFGIYGKNKEIESFRSYISDNEHLHKNHIFIFDRCYFSYAFMKFLIVQDIKFIIRVRGKGNNLDKNKKILKNTVNYNDLMFIRDKIKTIKYDETIHKIIYNNKSKKEQKEYEIDIMNNCILVTNIEDNNYTDEHILDLYKSRWDIEVHFKYLKSNFKFQHIKEKHEIKYRKMYLCELIIFYLVKLIEKYYLCKYKKKDIKINKTNLIKGIFEELIYEILKGKVTSYRFNIFCNSYILIIKNKPNRSFPRNSKTPFSKWYIKGYSDHTKLIRIIEASLDNKINELNKNDKMIANRIKKIIRK